MLALIFVGTDRVTPGSADVLVAQQIVGGITLLQRALRVALRAGASRVCVLSPDDAALRAHIESDSQLHLPIEWRHHERTLDEGATAILDALDDVDEPLWLATADRVFSPHMLPLHETPRLHVVEDAAGEAVGTYVATADALRDALSGAQSSLHEALQGQGERLRATGGTWHIARRPEDRSPAMRALFRMLRKPLGRDADGLAAYYLNRPVSMRMSWFLANTSVTPNQVTTVALLFGVAAGALVSTGDYLWMLLGALSLQLSSIMDGVDGELARTRLTSNKAGEWYDTVCDDVINISFMAGLGVAAYRVTGIDAYLTVTTTVVIIGAVLVGFFYRELILLGVASHNHYEWGFESKTSKTSDAPKEKKDGPIQKVLVGFSYLAKRDSYTVLLMVLVALGLVQVPFAIMATGTCIIASAYVVQKVLKAKHARAAG